MARNDFISAVLLGIAYVLLIRVLVGITATWGAIAESDLWQQSVAHAIAYGQFYHSIGVLLAALPVGLAIALRFRNGWFHPAILASIIGSLYMLFDQLRGIWYMSQLGVAPGLDHLVSGAIDVAKVGLILLVVGAILKRVLVASGERA